jgi:predicted nucleic acid-binding protein
VEPERAFADTNVFLRLLTNDVPPQADAVEQLLRAAAAGDVILLVTTLTIAEIVWTLESFDGLAKAGSRRTCLPS